MEHRRAGAERRGLPAGALTVRVLPVRPGAEAVGRDRRRFVIQLAYRRPHRSEGLRLVLDARSLNELQPADLFFGERDTSADNGATGMLNHQGGMMERRMGGVDREERHRECSGTRGGVYIIYENTLVNGGSYDS